MDLAIKTKTKDIKIKGGELTAVICRTMKLLSDLVGVTLGPGGNTVLIERIGMPPLTTKDGVTVAESISFRDATQHVISEAAKEVCQRTNKEAGDGTTTAIVLAQAIIESGLNYLANNATKSPQELCRELDFIVRDVVSSLEKSATPVSTKDDILKVAMISSNSDGDVAKAVVEAMDLVGEDGTVVTEDGKNRETIVELREGFTVNKGLSALGVAQEIFINNPSNQECVLEVPYVLLYDGDIMSPQDLGIFLGRSFQEMKQDNSIRPVVVMAHKFSPLTIRMIAENVRIGTANIVMLETAATGQPNSKHHLLHDLAAFTGATVLDPITNPFSKASLKSLGACGKVRAGRYQTVFFDADEPALVKSRMEVLKTQMQKAESDFDAEIIKERIRALSGGIATIYVGGSTELEMREKKHRIEDTINAVRSAIEMGVIPGGGSALLAEAQRLRSGGFPPQAEILASAFAVPFARIMENAGDSTRITEAVQKVVENYPNIVYNSLTHEYSNPIKDGIVDPVKVTISALNNALSIANMLMTIGGTVVIPRDSTEEAQAEALAQGFAKQMQGA